MRPSIADLIGIKYKTNGKNKIEGFDCYTFVQCVENRFGHPMRGVSYDGSFEKAFEDNTENVIKRERLIETKTPAYGDIILFLDGKGRGIHVGVYLEDNRFAHCDKQGSHVSSLDYYMTWSNWRFYTWSD